MQKYLGILFAEFPDGTLQVQGLIRESPASRCKPKPAVGDVLISVQGNDAGDLSPDQIAALLQDRSGILALRFAGSVGIYETRIGGSLLDCIPAHAREEASDGSIRASSDSSAAPDAASPPPGAGSARRRRAAAPQSVDDGAPAPPDSAHASNPRARPRSARAARSEGSTEAMPHSTLQAAAAGAGAGGSAGSAGAHQGPTPRRRPGAPGTDPAALERRLRAEEAALAAERRRRAEAEATAEAMEGLLAGS